MESGASPVLCPALPILDPRPNAANLKGIKVQTFAGL